MVCEALQAACCDLFTEVVCGAGSASLKVTGFSMLPAIWPGDVLTVESIPSHLFQADQIALYRRDGKLVAHRVIRSAARSGEPIFTRGDAIPSPDPPVEPDRVVGRVVAIHRRGRAVSLHFSPWKRVTAWLLRRSDAFTRLLMRWSVLDRRWLRPDFSRAPTS